MLLNRLFSTFYNFLLNYCYLETMLISLKLLEDLNTCDDSSFQTCPSFHEIL